LEVLQLHLVGGYSGGIPHDPAAPTGDEAMKPEERDFAERVLCFFGIHAYVLFRELTVCGRDSAALGGYVFNPSKKKIFVCASCGKRKDEIYDFRGERTQ